MSFEPYRTVYALMLSWEDAAEKEFKKQRQKLRQVLAAYNFDVEDYDIPSTEPYRKLNRRLGEFLDRDVEGALLIVYYGGHAITDRDRNNLWVCHNTQRQRETKKTRKSTGAPCRDCFWTNVGLMFYLY